MGLRARVVTVEESRHKWTTWLATKIYDENVGARGLYDALMEHNPGLLMWDPVTKFKNVIGNNKTYPWCGSAYKHDTKITLQLSCPSAEGEMMCKDFDTAKDAIDWLDSTGVPVRTSAFRYLEGLCGEQSLLEKYMSHIADVEGSTFLTDHYKDLSPDMTDAEWAKLHQIEQAVCAKRG